MDFYSQFASLHPISRESFEELTDCMKRVRFSKGEILIREGDIQRDIFFMRSGAHYLYLNNDGKEHIIAFAFPPRLSVIPDSLHFQTPSRFYIECLTDGEMDILPYSKLEELFDRNHEIERLFRKLLERVLAGFIDRFVELRSMTIEERFHAFARRSAHLLDQIPHKHIASYLNIDPTNFSKLFNSVKI